MDQNVIEFKNTLIALFSSTLTVSLSALLLMLVNLSFAFKLVLMILCVIGTLTSIHSAVIILLILSSNFFKEKLKQTNDEKSL